MWLGLARAFVHDGAVTKAIFGCKSVPEALGAQMNLVKTNTAKLVAENRKMTDMSANMAAAATESLAKCVAATVEYSRSRPPSGISPYQGWSGDTFGGLAGGHFFELGGDYPGLGL
jgi:hypothetical protein